MQTIDEHAGYDISIENFRKDETKVKCAHLFDPTEIFYGVPKSAHDI